MDGSGSGGSEAGGDEEGFESDGGARSGGAGGSSEALDSGSSSHESDSSPGRHVHDSDIDDEHARRRVCRFFNRAEGCADASCAFAHACSECGSHRHYRGSERCRGFR